MPLALTSLAEGWSPLRVFPYTLSRKRSLALRASRNCSSCAIGTLTGTSKGAERLGTERLGALARAFGTRKLG